MRKIALVAAAIAALSVTACSEGTEDAAEVTADSAIADTETNLDTTGNAIEGTAMEAGAAVEGAADTTVDAADAAAANAEATLQDETVTEAAID